MAYTQRIQGRTRARRNAAILRASDICYLCGHPGADSVDHIVPLARGGTEDPENLAPAHLSCNKAKGAKMPDLVIRNSGSIR